MQNNKKPLTLTERAAIIFNYKNDFQKFMEVAEQQMEEYKNQFLMPNNATPEMYEALKEYIDYVERKLAQRTNTFYQHMKKAINKADGK